MPEPHHAETQPPAPALTDRAEVDVRLSATEDRGRLRRKKIYDKAAGLIISFGGIAIILSIAAILFVIVAETLPLWSAPKTEFGGTLRLSELLNGQTARPIAFGVEEYQEIAYVVTEDGWLHFISLTDQTLLQSYEIRQLQGQRPTAVYQDGFDHSLAIATENGTVVPVYASFVISYDDQSRRIITPRAGEEDAILVDPQGRAIQRLVYRTGEDDEGIRIAALLGPRSLVFYSQVEQESSLGQTETQETRRELSSALPADVTALALDIFLTNLLVSTADGQLLHWQVQDPAAPRLIHSFPVSDTGGVSATTLDWLLGERSLVVGDSAGGVGVWFQVRDQGPPRDSPYRKIHVLESHPAALTAMKPSARNKGFLTADADGHILLHHATSEQTLVELRTDQGAAVELLSFAPRANGIFAVDNQARLFDWSLDNPHPEINLTTLFGKVWYEGYQEPDYTWQSSSATDDFEPKFSLTPLAYGTLKGNLLCAPAGDSAQPVRGAVHLAVHAPQPAQPGQAVGRGDGGPAQRCPGLFLPACGWPPLVADMVPAIFMMLVALPGVTLLAAFAWRLVPLPVRNSLKPGVEFALCGPAAVADGVSVRGPQRCH